MALTWLGLRRLLLLVVVDMLLDLVVLGLDWVGLGWVLDCCASDA